MEKFYDLQNLLKTLQGNCRNFKIQNWSISAQVSNKLQKHKRDTNFWTAGFEELRSYGVTELRSSDLHILKGGALQSGHPEVRTARHAPAFHRHGKPLYGTIQKFHPGTSKVRGGGCRKNRIRLQIHDCWAVPCPKNGGISRINSRQGEERAKCHKDLYP